MSFDLEPGYGRGRSSSAIVSTISYYSPVALDTEGTLDWCFVGNHNVTLLPFQVTVTNPQRKYAGTDELHKAFSWRFGTGGTAFNQASARFMTAAAADNTNGAALNNDNSCGYFSPGSVATDLLGGGFQLVLDAHRVSRRLRIHMNLFDCESTCTAYIRDVSPDHPDVAERSSAACPTFPGNGRSFTYIVDYASAYGGQVVVDVEVTRQFSVNSHYKVQAFSLALTP